MKPQWMNKPATLEKTLCSQKIHFKSKSMWLFKKAPTISIFHFSFDRRVDQKFSVRSTGNCVVFRVGSSFHCSYLKCMRGMFHAKTNLKLGNCSSRIFRLFTILSQQTGELIRLHTVCCQRQVTFYTLHIIFYKTFK